MSMQKEPGSPTGLDGGGVGAGVNLGSLGSKSHRPACEAPDTGMQEFFLLRLHPSPS